MPLIPPEIWGAVFILTITCKEQLTFYICVGLIFTDYRAFLFMYGSMTPSRSYE